MSSIPARTPRHRLIPGLSLIALLLLIAACETGVCHHGIMIEVEPSAVTLAIGESVTPSATIDSCPDGVRPLVLLWTPEDSTVVSVDAESGTITGLTVGDTDVVGANQSGSALYTLPVQVRD